jgi:hypothetical protein
VLFKCPTCKSNRTYTIPPSVRTRTLRCSKCGETTRCLFNRRIEEREQQSGRIQLFYDDGQRIEVDLFDISMQGAGLEVSVREIMRLAVGKYVSFKCSWNPKLLSQGRYIVRSINGLRVGIERLG